MAVRSVEFWPSLERKCLHQAKKKMTEQDKCLERWSTFNLLSTENYRNYSNHNFLGWIPDLNTITS